MPSLVIDTNISTEKIPQEFFSQMTQVLADTLSKPVSYCCVQIRPNQMMTWAGTLK